MKATRFHITRSRLLAEPAFVKALRAPGIELTRIAQPKQSETTQRWKLTLRHVESGAEVPTDRYPQRPPQT